MARDVEVDVKVNDKSAPGLTGVEKRFRESGKKIEKEYDRFGKGAGDAILAGIGSVAPKLAGKLADGIGDSARLGAPLLISGITAALPVISGLVASAISVGGVSAGIAAGVALAARDSRVKASGQALKDNILSALTADAAPFVQPVLAGIATVQKKFGEVRPAIQSIFKNTAPLVEPLADAVGEVGKSLIEGLDEVIQNSGPTFDAFLDGIKGTGEAVKGFLIDVVGDGEAGAENLRNAFEALNTTITALGKILGPVAEAFAFIDKINPSPLSNINRLFDETDKSARRGSGGTFGFAGAMQIAGDQAKVAEQDTKLYEKALKDNEAAARDAANAQRSLFDDVTRVGEAEANTSKALRDNGKTLDANTEKGRANRTALSNMASAYNAVRENMVKANKPAGEVNATLSTQRNRLIEAANKAGVYGSKARALADSLLGIKPRSVDVNVKTAAAQANARNLRDEMNQIRSKTVTVSVNVNASRLAAVENRLARLQKSGYYAAGDSFGELAPGQTARTGGPTTVQSNVSISLDGAPFRSYSVEAVESNRKREAFRTKVGRRDGQ